MLSAIDYLSSFFWDGDEEGASTPTTHPTRREIGMTPPAQTMEELKKKMERRGQGHESPPTLLDWWRKTKGVLLRGEASSLAERMLVIDVPGDGYCLLNAINVQVDEEDFLRPGELKQYMEKSSCVVDGTCIDNPLYYIPEIWVSMLSSDLPFMDVRNYKECNSLDMFWCILIADILQRAIIVVSNKDDTSMDDPTRLYMDVFLPVLHKDLRLSPLYLIRDGFHFMQLMFLDCEERYLLSDRRCKLESLGDDVRLRIYTKDGGPFPFRVSDPNNPLPLYFQILSRHETRA